MGLNLKSIYDIDSKNVYDIIEGIQEDNGTFLAKAPSEADLKDERTRKEYASWQPSVGQHGSKSINYPLYLRDDDCKFQQRYVRNTPILIEPGRRDTETGLLESFTILF